MAKLGAFDAYVQDEQEKAELAALKSGYDKDQSVVFDWASSHGFTPVTSEINDLLSELRKAQDEQANQSIL